MCGDALEVADIEWPIVQEERFRSFGREPAKEGVLPRGAGESGEEVQDLLPSFGEPGQSNDRLRNARVEIVPKGPGLDHRFQIAIRRRDHADVDASLHV